MSEHYTSPDSDESDCGEPKVISEDGLTYHFESSENPNVFWTVDLRYYDCNGRCSCPNFECRKEKPLRDGWIKPHTEAAKCKHIKRAEKILCYKVKKMLTEKHQPKPRNPDEDRDEVSLP